MQVPPTSRAPVQSPVHSSRPYRSHKYPACDFCRRRKSRCVRDLDNGPCIFCQAHQTLCTRNGASSDHDRPRRAEHERERPQRRSRDFPPSHSQRATARGRPQTSRPLAGKDETDLVGDEHEDSHIALGTRHGATQSSHIVGPASAHEIQVLDQYMSSTGSGSGSASIAVVRSNPYSVYSDDSRSPVVYIRVPRRPVLPITGNGTTGFQQLEAIESVLGPHCQAVVELYFDQFHPAFPLLDQGVILDTRDKGQLPQPLACQLYAVSLTFWRRSSGPALRSQPCPDVRHIRSQAVSALHDDFTVPSFATVLSCLLDLTGRPTTSMTYDAVNVGRLVALSQSLGLNRSIRNGQLDSRKRALRVRTWWAILIHDWWASLAHGTPPHIQPEQFDIDVPDLKSLLASPQESGMEDLVNPCVAGAHSFLFLCRLTEIIAGLLPLAFGLKKTKLADAQKSFRKLETLLDAWEESLPQWLSYKSPEFRRGSPGALNLHLYFLTVHMCMGRVSLMRMVDFDVETRLYYQSRCRKASLAILDFVLNLQEPELDSFWLPYSSYFISSALTMMLGCALEAASDDIARSCVAKARQTINYLRKAKDESGWDLGDVCLTRCETVVQQMGNERYLEFRRQRAQQLWSSSVGVETVSPSLVTSRPSERHATTTAAAPADTARASLESPSDIHRPISTSMAERDAMLCFTPDNLPPSDFGEYDFFSVDAMDLVLNDPWNPAVYHVLESDDAGMPDFEEGIGGPG